MSNPYSAQQAQNLLGDSLSAILALRERLPEIVSLAQRLTPVEDLVRFKHQIEQVHGHLDLLVEASEIIAQSTDVGFDLLTAHTPAIARAVLELGTAALKGEEYFATAAEFDALQTQLNTLVQSVADLVTQLQTEASKVTALQADSAEQMRLHQLLETRVATLETLPQQIGGIEDQVGGIVGDIEDLSQKVEGNTGSIAAAASANQETRTLLSDLEGVVTTTSQSLLTLQATLNNLSNGLEGIALAVEDVTSRVSATENSLDIQSQRTTTLESRATNLEASTAANALAVGNLSTRVTATETNYLAVSTEQTQLRSDYTSLSNDVSAVGTAQQELISRTDVIEGNIDVLTQQSTRLVAELSGSNNQLRNTDFMSGLAGWSITSRGQGWENAALERNLLPNRYLPEGLNTLGVYSNAALSGSITIGSSLVSVTPSTDYIISGYVAGVGMTVTYEVVMYDEAGSEILMDGFIGQATAGDGGMLLRHWPHHFKRLTTPQNAGSMRIRVIGYAPSGSEHAVLLMRPMVEMAKDGQTRPSAYVPGPVDVDSAIASVSQDIYARLTATEQGLEAASGQITTFNAALDTTNSRITIAEQASVTRDQANARATQMVSAELAYIKADAGAKTFRQQTQPQITGVRKNLFLVSRITAARNELQLTDGYVDPQFGNAAQKVEIIASNSGSAGVSPGSAVIGAAAGTYYAQVQVKAGTATTVSLGILGSAGLSTWATLADSDFYLDGPGTISASRNSGIAHITGLSETEWTTIRMVRRTAVTGTMTINVYVNGTAAAQQSVGMSLYLFGFQLERDAFTAYQRVTSATDFDGSGLPVGSIWEKTDASNVVVDRLRYNGTAWESVVDTSRASAVALNDLTTNVGTINGNVTAQAGQISALTTRVGNTETAISNESQIRSTEISSLATRTGSVEARMPSGTDMLSTAASVAVAQSAAQAAADLAGIKGKVVFSSNAPVEADRLPQNLWIDTNGSANTPKRWDGSAWVVVTDKAATDAIAAANAAMTRANDVDARVTEVENAAVAANSAMASRASVIEARMPAGAGVLATDADRAAAAAAAQAAADLASAKGKILFGSTTPAVADRLPQNLWIDTTGGTNTPKRWNGSTWAAVSDKVAVDAAAAATTAQQTANNAIINAANAASAAQAASDLAGGKGKVIYGSSAPTGSDQAEQNLWIDTTGGANTPKRWNGSAWLAVSDKAATDAAVAATAAQQTANSAVSDAAAAQAAAQSASNLAGGKGKVIYGSTAPGAADQLDQNLWIDTSGGANTPKRWNGTIWAAVTDKIATDAASAASAAQQTANTAASNAAAAQSAAQAASDLAGGKGKVIYGSSVPAEADRQPQNLWIDTTSNANTPKRWNGSNWVAVTDKAATDAAAAAAAAQQTANTAVSNAAAAQAAAQAASDLAGGKGKVIYGSTAPATADRLPQNLWIDTNGNANTPKRWSGTAWVAVTDKAATDAAAAAAAAQAAANAAQETANTAVTNAAAAQAAAQSASTLAGGKGKVLYGSTTPAVADRLEQNLWIDTNGGANTPKRWNGSAWVAVTDKIALDAAAAAAAAAQAVTVVDARVTTVENASVSRDNALGSRITLVEARMPAGSGELASATSLQTMQSQVDANGQAIGTLTGQVTAANTAASQAVTATEELRASAGGGGNLLASTIVAGDAPWFLRWADSPVWSYGTDLLQDGRVPYGTKALVHYAYSSIPAGSSMGWSQVIPAAIGQRYIVSAYANPYQGRAEVQAVFVDANGNAIGSPVTASTTTYDGSIPSNLSRYTRLHVVTAPAPSNARTLWITLVTFKTSSTGADCASWWLRPMIEAAGEGQTQPSPWSAGGTETIASHTVSLDVNGYVSGTQSVNDGKRSSFKVHADLFEISKPGGGARTEFSNGNWRVYDANGVLRVRMGVW